MAKRREGAPVAGLRAVPKAVRAELRRLDLLEESDRYLSGLIAQVGEPKPADRARARALAGRIASRGVSVERV